LNFVDQGRTTVKVATIALAAAFALSSTVALAYTNHHKSGTKKYHGSYAYSYGGSSNNRGGLVGGADNGTYSPRYTRAQPQPYGWNNNWNNSYGWNNNYGNPNNRGANLVGGADNGTRRP